MGSEETGIANRRIELGIWAIAASVRCLYLFAAQPVFTIYYWDAASSLLENGTLAFDGVRTAALEPLYPLFLAAARLAVGERPVVVQMLQALVASAGAVYLYRLAVALAGSQQVGIVAGALFACYPLLVHHSVDGTESALVTTLLLAFAHRFVTVRTASDAAITGALLGLTVLARAVAVPLLAIAPVAAGVRNRRTGVLMAVSAAIVLAPYVIRNYAVADTIGPTRSGVNLFIANSAYTGGIVGDYGPDILLPYAEARLADEGLGRLPATPVTEHREDRAFLRLALAEIQSRPLDTLRLKIQHVGYFFSPFLVPYRIATETTRIQLGERGRSTVEHSLSRPWFQHVGYTLPYGVVLTLAAAGIYHRRRALARDAILWYALLTFAAVHAVFFPATRYRAPVEFVLLFYAAVGGVWAIDALSARRFSRGANHSSTATAA